MNEIEIKFLEIDAEDLEKRLIDLGAEKVSDEMLEEWIYWRKDWAPVHGRVRIRKENSKLELAYKESTQDSSIGNLELEFTIDNIEAAQQFMVKMGAHLSRHQQKRRVRYRLRNVSIDIDFWPRIPPMVEIEGDNVEELEEISTQLELESTKRTELDAYQIYKQVYNVNLDTVKELVFEK